MFTRNRQSQVNEFRVRITGRKQKSNECQCCAITATQLFLLLHLMLLLLLLTLTLKTPELRLFEVCPHNTRFEAFLAVDLKGSVSLPRNDVLESKTLAFFQYRMKFPRKCGLAIAGRFGTKFYHFGKLQGFLHTFYFWSINVYCKWVSKMIIRSSRWWDVQLTYRPKRSLFFWGTFSRRELLSLRIHIGLAGWHFSKKRCHKKETSSTYTW